jgi:hypothetical protein
VIKSRRMRWTGVRATYVEEGRCIQGLRWGEVVERGHLEDVSVDGKVILK